ncbi:polysaccharide pyruvyl transferase family protein [Microbacterium marinilacus]|uniref:Polysaccharide pyruvyl transferase family protein n=2 Tax=Microbacterium marinilacus TaxID=415209 RepID=A0ABP7BBR8_9MICO
MAVEVVHWNPEKPVFSGPIGRRLPFKKPVNNFGDLLGPMLVERLLADAGVDEATEDDRRLLTVGSILHFAKPGDVVWGSGVNGKKRGIERNLRLDVRAVRGPVTRRVLSEAGMSVPEIYGDPGLLWGRFWPREHYVAEGRRQEVGVIPNLHDWKHYADDPRAISPQGDVHEVIGRIARCDFVVATSLHGIVIAESFGIPARLLPPMTEPMHKYFDYYRGTGRDGVRMAATIDEAIDLGGEQPPQWDGDALLAAFPYDLWR